MRCAAMTNRRAMRRDDASRDRARASNHEFAKHVLTICNGALCC
jgi:hypothetical protein